MQDDSAVCAYCAKAVLVGDEDPEHAIPAAINGRFTTKTVCTPCNRWAGKEVDKPWLDDPFVQDLRFQAAIPDRRGNVLTRSPFLAGISGDGRRVALGADGTPELLRLPVSTIYDLARTGRLPHLKIGRALGFSRSDLEAHLAERCRARLHERV